MQMGRKMLPDKQRLGCAFEQLAKGSEALPWISCDVALANPLL